MFDIRQKKNKKYNLHEINSLKIFTILSFNCNDGIYSIYKFIQKKKRIYLINETILSRKHITNL